MKLQETERILADRVRIPSDTDILEKYSKGMRGNSEECAKLYT